METERKLLKIPLGFRSKIPRRGIYEYQRPENFAKHNALCKRDENYGILMGKPNNAICLDYDIYDPNCKDKQKYTLEYFKKVCGDDVYISVYKEFPSRDDLGKLVINPSDMTGNV